MCIPVCGWVFIDDETGEEVGFAPASDFESAEDAYESFRSEYADHFGVCFRGSDGIIHPCCPESTPQDFA